MQLVMIQQWALMRIYLDRDKAAAKPPPHWIFFWAALAAGILVKGPIAPAIAILTIGSLILWHRGGRWVRPLRIWRGLVLMAVICLPWAILVTIATDGAFLDIAVTGDFLAKVQSGQESHGAPPFTYLALLACCCGQPQCCCHRRCFMSKPCWHMIAQGFCWRGLCHFG